MFFRQYHTKPKKRKKTFYHVFFEKCLVGKINFTPMKHLDLHEEVKKKTSTKHDMQYNKLIIVNKKKMMRNKF